MIDVILLSLLIASVVTVVVMLLNLLNELESLRATVRFYKALTSIRIETLQAERDRLLARLEEKERISSLIKEEK